ncbi:MAG: ribonuclease D [Oscillatoriales cyanobacterium]|jgi:ribonuclease D|nr:MAG: ribonuclease D [Oscillatoriales cyanobacterium]
MTAPPINVFDRDLSPEMLDRYLKASDIAVDTETMGLNPLRDRLCLVQLCDPEGETSVIRIERGQTSAPNLKQLLEASHSTKIFHFARFDLATLRHHLGIYVAPMFCTKVASKLARTYTDRHGLKSLVSELTGVELDKTAQSSDWGNAHHLTHEQLSYAANDVRYLIGVKQTLVMMIDREERLELLTQCFDVVPTLVTLDLLQYNCIFTH